MKINPAMGIATIQTKHRGVLQQRGVTNSDPEVLEKPTRRRFTAEYKLRILQEVNACTKPGSIGALLRRQLTPLWIFWLGISRIGGYN